MSAPISEGKAAQLIELWAERYRQIPKREAARKLGIPESTLRTLLQRFSVDRVESEFEIAEPEDEDLPIEEIIAHRKKQFAQKKKHEDTSRLIPVTIKLRGTIGILHFGDPHVDDDGTDIAALEHHSDLTTSVDGLFGANVGDNTNAWVGRLARLYAHQGTTRRQALKIAEWLLRRTKWIYMVGGNHDGWAGDDDPVQWIKQSGTLYRPSEARLELRFPEGAPFTINARHDFAGGSQWNPTHGPMKAAQLGVRDDLYTCGHKHISGYGVLKDAITGKVCHCLQVGAYKLIDRYAKERNFRDQMLGPAALTTIDPALPPNHPDRCKVFWDPDEGAEYLKFKRRGL